ncbi:hypothetical protein [Pelosinus sp. IPA-1]|uniref:hypothetical protein n=1 Tax=Pelosinus sp. IPA-1 TaxID=3029569 RepID=UPI0024361B48|nr:hypothetical protein [Pelosinus sp. IPA-1]GMA99532.1 hypothetical protein PIPA1_23320 [Pelosinus sp. IPA-1]
MNAGTFKENVPADWLNDADILVVSPKCGHMINYHAISQWISPIHADKYYIPRNLVYKYPDGNKKRSTIGCIELQIRRLTRYAEPYHW